MKENRYINYRKKSRYISKAIKTGLIDDYWLSRTNILKQSYITSYIIININYFYIIFDRNDNKTIINIYAKL